MSGAGNYCRTDSAVPQSAAGAGPAQQHGLGGVAGVGGHWGGGGGGGIPLGGGGGGWWPRTREHIWTATVQALDTYPGKLGSEPAITRHEEGSTKNNNVMLLLLFISDTYTSLEMLIVTPQRLIVTLIPQ